MEAELKICDLVQCDGLTYIQDLARLGCCEAENHFIRPRNWFAHAYRKVFYDGDVWALFPGSQTPFLAGDLLPAFAISLLNGRERYNRFIQGSNHFVGIS